MRDRARWNKIQSVFGAVLDAAPEERAALLDAACQGDLTLRKSVEDLLAADSAATDQLATTIGAAAESLLQEYKDRLLGNRVGPYRVSSILGYGGMSTVYRGERDDDKYQQTVAIKVLHHSGLHPRLRSRLHSERHILATLDHPLIARLIDSGDLEDGTPYLVMEHVAGESIDEYCDRKMLSVRERLELFLQVCTAVQYAHRNLVVHSDIKPSNIFITADGTVKLLDFGIAKLLAPESISHTLPVTRLQERVLTPENAAPEQVLGRPITTTTDIYALGVLLYQMLTGRSPYRLLSYSQLQLERAICMDDPVRPSQVPMSRLSNAVVDDRDRIAAQRRTSPERLRAALAGDLDAIIGMAMRKEPDRRYPSVEALADDVCRHLVGRPAQARQGDWRYYTAKFLRRHALGVFVVSAVMFGLAGVAGVTLWQNHRIELAREAVAQERDNAQKVSAFLVDDVFSQADPFTSQGHELSARDLLDRGSKRILTNPALQPEVRAQLLESIGQAYRHLGLIDQAVPMFEHAVAIRRDEKPLDPHQVAVALANLAQALTDSGQIVSAEAYLRQALVQSTLGDGARSVRTGDILSQLGQLQLNAKSNPQAASEYFNEALSIYQGSKGRQSLLVASSLNDLASAALWTGDYSAAERYQREVIEILQSAISRSHPDYAAALETLGVILRERGQYRESEQVLNEALDIDQKVFGRSSPRGTGVKSHLAVLYELEGDLPRALAAAQNVVKTSIARFGPTHYLTGYYIAGLAAAYLKAGEFPAAERTARQALEVYAQASIPARHLYVATARQLLGDILVERGSLAAAETELRAAVDVTSSLAGPDSWRTARAQASLGWAMIEHDKAAEGLPLLTSSQRRLFETLGAHHQATEWATLRLVEYFKNHHRDAEAAQLIAP